MVSSLSLSGKMNITINDLTFPEGGTNGFRHLIARLMSHYATEHPGHRIIFFTDKYECLQQNITTPNILFIPFGEKKGVVGKIVQQYYRFPAALRRYKPDIHICINSYPSSLNNIPQILFIDGIGFAQNPPKNALKTLVQVKSIITSSHFFQRLISAAYQIEEKNIEVIYTLPSGLYAPREEAFRNRIKKEHTNGMEYFLCEADTNEETELIVLLKAYSQFKKWQRSSMPLVLASCKADFPENFEKMLSTYKYKNDVKILTGVNDLELSELYSAAYCYINPFSNISYRCMLQAIQCHIPVISRRHEIFEEICGNAVIYVNEDTAANFASLMIDIYKDENKRADMIEKGKAQLNKYDTSLPYKQLNKLLRRT